MSDAVSAFGDAIASAGLLAPETIEADGRLHRYPTDGKHGDDAGWYILHSDGIPAGAFGCWREGIGQTWRADIGRKLTDAEEFASA
ncbi:hypothetical protein [Candidatus Thiosymbion oneisti]|uniref:hypothetical protein n=1 Tax=Candidatus Thiosymbion oneisti TaxID=589554 RepID=UPI000B7EB072|nr:hypothetical protein [Candidatus Thiosymbion oneisti]